MDITNALQRPSTRAVFFMVAMVGLLIINLEGLSEAVYRWGYQPEYSHGYMIPIVSLYMLWQNLPALRAAWQDASIAWLLPGLFVVVLSLLVSFIGDLAAMYILIQGAFVLGLLGMAMMTLGRGARICLPSIILLGFAIPLPYFIEVIITAKLQLMSSALAVSMIRLMDIPVFLSGNVIDLGNYKLQVVEACSGLRYLFPLMSIGFIGACFYRTQSHWKRVVLFISTIPITILMNSFRIAIAATLFDRFGITASEGFMHDFEGWVIFLICGLVLILEVIIMERLTTRIPLREVFTPPVFKSENRAVSSPKTHESIAMMFVAVMSIGAAIVSDRLENRSEMIPTLPELSQYPLWLNGWQGQPSPLSAEVIDALLLNEHIKINYQKDQIPLTFYVAWYASQRKGASPHSPRVCIPGGGWEIADFRRTRVDEMPINRVVIRKGEQKQLVYYWFEERGKPIANEYYKKWALLRDAILMNRTDGALVRISSPIMEHEPIEITEQRLKDFTRDARSRLSELLNDQKSLVL